MLPTAYMHIKKKKKTTSLKSCKSMKRPHLNIVFKTTAIQKLTPNLEITFQINMKRGKKSSSSIEPMMHDWNYNTTFYYRKNRSWIACPPIKSSLLATAPPFHTSVSVPASTPASLFHQANFCSPTTVRADIPFCFWLHDLRGFMNHNWELSMPIPNSNDETKHFISITNTFLMQCWATKCTSFNQLTINKHLKWQKKKSSVPGFLSPEWDTVYTQNIRSRKFSF